MALNRESIDRVLESSTEHMTKNDPHHAYALNSIEDIKMVMFIFEGLQIFN